MKWQRTHLLNCYPFLDRTFKYQFSEFGKSLVEVQSMMKRHQLLEADIANHNSIVEALVAKGEQLVRSNHQQSQEIQQVVQDMVKG